MTHHRKPAFRIETLEPRVVLAADVLISEFQAINDSTLADGDGIFSDWIELHNPTSTAVSLDGWHLTDDRNDLSRWALPSIELDSGGYLVVFASGRDTRDAGENYHTNFKLSGSGEDLLLVEPDGVTYDGTFLDYPSQTADVAYGISLGGVSATLVDSSSPLTYRVPTLGEDIDTWTAVGFDDSSFVREQTVAGSGLLITEIDTGEKKVVEIQNVSSAPIDTTGWTVVINDPASGPDAVASTTWTLPNSVGPAEILYRTDQSNDQYWGNAIPWQLDGPGWVMVVDEVGKVQDFAAWGYSDDQIAAIGSIEDQWIGAGRRIGNDRCHHQRARDHRTWCQHRCR